MPRFSHEALTAERARHLFDYDPKTGLLTWKNPTARSVKAGAVAGTKGGKGDYRYVSADGVMFMAHRVIWLMVYGQWPEGDVSVRNGNFEDLRIENLFQRSALETALSKKNTRAKSGIRGVYQQPGGKWSAQIRRNYHMTHLGTFPTKEAAAAAVEAASKLPALPIDAEVRNEGAFKSRHYGLVHSLWVRTLRDFDVVPAWKELAAFSEAVGNQIYPQCRMTPIDPDKPLGPGNFQLGARAKYDRKTPEGRKAYYDYMNRTRSAQRMDHHRLSTFGVTPEQYAQLMEEQKGLCAICKRPETGKRGDRVLALAVDHCHKTGKVRGLLCRDCNHSLGKMQDDPVRLRAAADYVERHLAQPSTSVPASHVTTLKPKERSPL